MKEGLPKVLGRLEATTVVVGSMIGSGIFLKGQAIAALLPHPWLILNCWLLAGLLTLSGTLVVAELSARFSGSGGVYLFLRHAYGPRVAFLFGWSLIAVLQSGSIAGLATGMAQILATQLNWDMATQRSVAYLAIASLTLLHCLSVNVGARWLQNGLTFIKYLGLCALIALGLFSGHADPANLQPTQPLPAWGALISALGVIVLKALWAYDGWANATFIAGEVRDARKNLPQALIGGTLMVVLLYLCCNATYHLVLNPVQVAESKSPAVAVAGTCMGVGFAFATGLLLALSMLGTLNSSILSAPRVYYAMAQAGQFPAWMGTLSRFQTPYIALLLQGAWAAVLVSAWGTFDQITDNVVFIYWIFYALCVASALRYPPPSDGYRAPARKLLVSCFVTGAALLVISQLVQAPLQSLQALGLLLVGNIFYRAGRQTEESTA